MISATCVRGATTYTIIGHPDRGGMLISASFRRSRMFGERPGYDALCLDFAPDSPVPLTMSGGPDGDAITGPDRYDSSWSFWRERGQYKETIYELMESRRAELVALARDLSDARDVRTSADLSPWLKRYADIVGGVQP